MDMRIYLTINESNIEDFLTKSWFNWSDYCEHSNLNEKLIEKYSDQVDWINISIFQELKEEFIRKHIDKFDLYILEDYQDLSDEFKQEYGLI